MLSVCILFSEKNLLLFFYPLFTPPSRTPFRNRNSSSKDIRAAEIRYRYIATYCECVRRPAYLLENFSSLITPKVINNKRRGFFNAYKRYLF